MKDKDKKEPLPFPETDYSPGLQRTLKEKFDKGENPSVDKETFFKALGRAAHPTEDTSASFASLRHLLALNRVRRPEEPY